MDSPEDPRVPQSIRDRLRASLEGEKQAIRSGEKTIEDLRIIPYDQVNDDEELPSGEKVERTIYQWTDRGGYTFYTVGHNHRPGERVDLRNSIQVQEKAWGELDPAARASLEEEYKSSDGTSESTQPFSAFLESKALSKRFAQIKAGQ